MPYKSLPSASPCRSEYMLILPFKSCSMCSPLPWIKALRLITGWGQGSTRLRQGEKNKHLYLNFPPWVLVRRWGACIGQMWGTWGKRTSHLNPHASSGSFMWLSLATCPYSGTITWKWTLSCKLARPRAALVFLLSPAVPASYVVRDEAWQSLQFHKVGLRRHLSWNLAHHRPGGEETWKKLWPTADRVWSGRWTVQARGCSSHCRRRRLAQRLPKLRREQVTSRVLAQLRKNRCPTMSAISSHCRGPKRHQWPEESQ